MTLDALTVAPYGRAGPHIIPIDKRGFVPVADRIRHARLMARNDGRRAAVGFEVGEGIVGKKVEKLNSVGDMVEFLNGLSHDKSNPLPRAL